MGIIMITVILSLLVVVMAADEDEHMLNDLFGQYIAKYGKSYETDEEWAHRKKLFKETHREV
jgi:hypothetical protein